MRRASLWLLLSALFVGCGPVCGNGEIEDGEQCDDGNTVDGDFCSAECTIEFPEGFALPLEGSPATDLPPVPWTPQRAHDGARSVQIP